MTVERYLKGLLMGALLAVLLPAVTLSADMSKPERPKVGLVLSGGGARGAAHIGVLKVLNEMRIPVDYVAGTSMGAIVGGLYASGMSIDDLDSVVRDNDWSAFYSDRTPRSERSLRRKSDDEGFLVDFDVGLKGGQLVFPQGLVQGQTFEIALRRWLLPVATTRDFDELPVPFRAVATDVATGEMIVLKSGDLASAIRASMSAPGALKPVRLDGRLLVDGGIANNLPIQVVKDMGADILIVVDVGFPLLKEEELTSALAMSSQMLTILIQANSNRQLKLLSGDDVLITPALGRLDSTAFDRNLEAMDIGERSAREVVEQLRGLAVSEDVYASHRVDLARRRSGMPVIDSLRIENQSLLSPEVIAARLADHTGDTLDVDKLEADIREIYAFDTFESVTYSIDTVDGQNELLLTGKQKSWGPSYLRFGVNFEDDFEGDSRYNIAARLTKTEMNRLGGEFRLEAQIGTNPRLFAEFHQPLNYDSRWFISPSVEISRNNEIVFDNSGNRLAQSRSKQTVASLAGGREFGNWGEFRVAMGQFRNDSSIRIGDPSAATVSNEVRGVLANLEYDTLDALNLPRYGALANLQWFSSREDFNSDVVFDSVSFSGVKPYTWGKNTLLNWWTLGSVTKGDVNSFSLGGLFSLSGYARNEIAGKHTAIGRIIYYRRLGDTKLTAFDTAIYLGASLEAGNVWQDESDISFGSALTAGSLFVVMDTPIGPIYLAYGAAEGNRQSAYLFVGQTF